MDLHSVGTVPNLYTSSASTRTCTCDCLQALCRLTKHNVAVFQNVIEKVGLQKMLSALAVPISRVQQNMLTMFAALITSDARLTRLVQDKVCARHHVRRPTSRTRFVTVSQ